MWNRLYYDLIGLVMKFPRLFEFVYHIYRFFQVKYTAGVVGIVFNPQGQVLLVEHVFHPRTPWGLPGGWIGYNEDPALAVEREIREELELVVRAGQVVSAEKTERNHFDFAFLCEAQSEVGQVCRELHQYRWYDVAELPPMRKFHWLAVHRAKALLEAQRFVSELSIE